MINESSTNVARMDAINNNATPEINIRTGAGTNYAKTGETTGKGVFTIVEVKAGQGASAGWGRLKSGAGWISLDYATRLA